MQLHCCMAAKSSMNIPKRTARLIEVDEVERARWKWILRQRYICTFSCRWLISLSYRQFVWISFSPDNAGGWKQFLDNAWWARRKNCFDGFSLFDVLLRRSLRCLLTQERLRIDSRSHSKSCWLSNKSNISNQKCLRRALELRISRYRCLQTLMRIWVLAVKTFRFARGWLLNGLRLRFI